MRRRELEKIRYLYGMKEMKALKRHLAKEISSQRKRLESISSPEEIYRAQARLEAYKEILDLGKKTRRAFFRLDSTRQ